MNTFLINSVIIVKNKFSNHDSLSIKTILKILKLSYIIVNKKLIILNITILIIIYYISLINY